MNKPSVAIVKSDFHGNHSSSWSNVWLDYCKECRLPHSLVDWRSLNAFNDLAEHDIVLWHFSHYSRDEMLFARSILNALKSSGCRVFPDVGDSDYFDDKVAQAYLLKGLGINTPKNYPIHSLNAVEEWIYNVGVFPVVAKLRTGSGASNVQLISCIEDLRQYSRNMFGRGLGSKPRAIYKIKSNITSTRSFAEFFTRLKRAPEFLFSRRNASSLQNERGYIYLQEFVPNVDHDLKVVVIKDKLSFIGRAVRAGEFRASGGGDLFYDRTYIDQSIIDTAFNAADALQSDCTGFDIIKDPKTGKPVILEISYGFSHTALLRAGGYFDRLGKWYEEPLDAPSTVLDYLIKEFNA